MQFEEGIPKIISNIKDDVFPVLSIILTYKVSDV